MSLWIRFLPPISLVLLSVSGIAADTSPSVGLRQRTPDAYALIGAQIIVAPGEEIESGTIVIRDGKIARVAAGDAGPPGVRQLDLDGKRVYAGFIESYTDQSISATPPSPSYWNDQVTPQRVIARLLAHDASLNKTLRSQGFGARLVAPRDGIIKGQSALVLTSDGHIADAILDDSVALHLRLTRPFGRRSGYPTSPMGAVALARQACYDAQWFGKALAAVRADPSLPRPDANLALRALEGYLDSGGLVIADAPNELFNDRADRFAREFSLRLVVLGSGNEYRRLDELRRTRRAVIVPVDFPKPPDVSSPEGALSASLEELMHWRLAPENPGRLAQAGVKFALTTDGLNKRGDFLARLRKAIERGLSPDDALRALTTTPAELFDVDDQLGTIEVGKIANLVVADGDLFAKGKLVATWVNGKPYDMISEPIASFVGHWKLTTAEPIGESQTWQLNVTGKPAKPAATIGPQLEAHAPAEGDDQADEADQTEEDETAKDEEDAADDAEPDVATHDPSGETASEENGEAKAEEEQDSLRRKATSLKLSGYRLTGAVSGKELGIEGHLSFSATLIQSDDERLLSGTFRLASGAEVQFTGIIEKPQEDNEQPEIENVEQDGDNEEQPAEDTDKDEGEDVDQEEYQPTDSPLIVRVNYPLGTYGLEEAPEQEHVALVNATVWTCCADGVLEGGTVHVESGKIVAVGYDVELPDGVKTINCEGRHITPGIIDCHSHMATDGGLNEIGQAITAEVRVGDFIDPDDMTIYRQLAGGVTTANVLHGSANPIGGQSQVIKLRWGASAKGLRFESAPPSIKFALGENVKQSNWEQAPPRYPQSRMGVDELMIDAFRAALAYRGEHRRWERDRAGLPPRRDLELEAILEILEHKRWIHCHSYRQSGILALLRTLEGFDIRIGTLQHILEGYKLAPELVAHGAMGSSFSDWWAYKFEVYDAIPHNGALMHQAGIVVSFNSDNNEMGRRLATEAAKACKYGGVSPEEALKFVTLNPAKQLRIDQQVGSLEPGKDADLVVWSGWPLSTYSRCEQTWVDGRRYFDIEQDSRLRERDQDLRAQLIQAVLASGESAAKEGENRRDPSADWPRYDEYCASSGNRDD